MKTKHDVDVVSMGLANSCANNSDLRVFVGLYRAAKVITLTGDTNRWLRKNDPMALSSLEKAIKDLEEEFGPRQSDGTAKTVDHSKVEAVREVASEMEAIARESIEHLSRLWWAFDSKDSRAGQIRRIASAYKARLTAASCGTPDPHLTDGVNDEMLGQPKRFDR